MLQIVTIKVSLVIQTLVCLPRIISLKYKKFEEIKIIYLFVQRNSFISNQCMFIIILYYYSRFKNNPKLVLDLIVYHSCSCFSCGL